MLMKYASNDHTETEHIWNSRDGVTPFVITLASGKSATHVSWNLDKYCPNYEPPLGSRVFVDLTPERARAFAEDVLRGYENFYVEHLPQDPVPTADELVEEYLRHPGAPDIITVTTEWRIKQRYNRLEAVTTELKEMMDRDGTEGS